MALAPHDVPITRDQVMGWLNIYKNLPKGKQQPLRDFLEARIEAAKLESDMVDTSGHETLRSTTSLVDMILMDLQSYGQDIRA
jgi:hypothetical protein